MGQVGQVGMSGSMRVLTATAIACAVGVAASRAASVRTGGNEYVWHCHILEHEEHDMMRPLIVM